MSLSVDVAIVAYNRFDLTESCLGHLGAQTRAHRVIVCDNGSTDDTRVRLREHWPQVQVVSFEENQGFSVACNRAVAAGDGDVVVLLNNDVDCQADFLERLLEPLEADPQVGAVASVMVQPGAERIDSVGLVADPTLAAFPRLQGRPVADARATEPLLTGPEGTGAAYRRRAWEAVGGLDERIFAYMEGLDLALRVRALGWLVVAAPRAVGVHLGSATHGRRSAWQRRHSGFSRGYLLRRYGLLRGRLAGRVLVSETVVVLGDLLISRDLAALRGRTAGWKAAAGLPRRSPPREAVDLRIGLGRSLALRRGVYSGQAV